MRLLLTCCLSLVSASVYAAERCFEVTAKEGASRPAGELCLDERPSEVVLSLKSGGAVATYRLKLINRVRCLDCNKDELGPFAPSDLDFLTVRFDGARTKNGEQGTVSFGNQRLFYRTPGLAAAAAPNTAPPPSGPQPMSAAAHAAVLKSLEEQSWSVSGIEGVVASAAKSNHFTSEQVAAILKKVPGMSLKESAARLLVPRIVDYDNLFLVSSEVGEDAQKFRVKAAPKN